MADGRAIAMAYIYSDRWEPFVLPVGLSDAEVAAARHAALHYAQHAENRPWVVGGDLDKADEVLAVTRTVQRLREKRLTHV